MNDQQHRIAAIAAQADDTGPFSSARFEGP
jgi:hypothetical protein